MSRTPEPYENLPAHERSWIDSLNPRPIATMTKEQVVSYLTGHGVPVTYYAVKRAVESGELPAKRIGKARRASELSALVWAATRDRDKAVSA